MEDLTRGRETNSFGSTTRKCYAFSKNEFILVALYTVYWSSDKVQLCHPKSFYFKLVKWTADFIKSYNELFFFVVSVMFCVISRLSLALIGWKYVTKIKLYCVWILHVSTVSRKEFRAAQNWHEVFFWKWTFIMFKCFLIKRGDARKLSDCLLSFTLPTYLILHFVGQVKISVYTEKCAKKTRKMKRFEIKYAGILISHNEDHFMLLKTNSGWFVNN